MNPVNRDQAQVLERIEMAAWRDVHAAALPADRDALHIRSRDLAGAFVMSCDREESLLANRVIGLGVNEPVGPDTLDALVAHYRDRVPGFALNLSPFAEPDALAAPLAERGFATFFHHLKWWRDASPVREQATSLRVVRAGVAQADAWGELCTRIFDWSPAQAPWQASVVGRPGWWHGLALHGDMPVAVGAVYVQGEAAWLGFGGTLPEYRRRGAQSALLAARVAHARAAGARIMALETAPDWPDIPGESLRNAARAGFHPAYERPSWIWPVR